MKQSKSVDVVVDTWEDFILQLSKSGSAGKAIARKFATIKDKSSGYFTVKSIADEAHIYNGDIMVVLRVLEQKGWIQRSGSIWRLSDVSRRLIMDLIYKRQGTISLPKDPKDDIFKDQNELESESKLGLGIPNIAQSYKGIIKEMAEERSTDKKLSKGIKFVSNKRSKKDKVRSAEQIKKDEAKRLKKETQDKLREMNQTHNQQSKVK